MRLVTSLFQQVRYMLDTTLLLQPYNCVVNLVTTLLYITVATNLLEQPRNKSDNAIKAC